MNKVSVLFCSAIRVGTHVVGILSRRKSTYDNKLQTNKDLLMKAAVVSKTIHLNQNCPVPQCYDWPHTIAINLYTKCNISTISGTTEVDSNSELVELSHMLMNNPDSLKGTTRTFQNRSFVIQYLPGDCLFLFRISAEMSRSMTNPTK